MPESVEIPAPVSTTTRRACSSSDRARAMSSSLIPIAAIVARSPPRILRRCPSSSCCTRPTPRTASAGRPEPCWPGAVEQGDRVAFALGSSADLICAVLGAARVGLIPVLLNATLTPGERDVLAADARPAVSVFTREDLAQLADDGTPTELAPHPLTRPMHYTSGTTGRPKGVTTGLWDEATAEAVFDDEAAVWHFDPKDLHLVCSPMYHTVSIRFAGGTLLAGGSLAILSRFDAATALDALRRHRPTTAFLVPTHLQRILQHPGLGDDERFDSLRLLAHAGAPCPESVKRATMARTRPGSVWEFYGSTEAQFTVCPPEDWLERPGTVGRARPGRRLDIVPVDADADATPTHRGPSGATCRPSPASVIGTTPPPPPPPGTASRAPSATSAASIRTASST